MDNRLFYDVTHDTFQRCCHWDRNSWNVGNLWFFSCYQKINIDNKIFWRFLNKSLQLASLVILASLLESIFLPFFCKSSVKNLIVGISWNGGIFKCNALILWGEISFKQSRRLILNLVEVYAFI